MAKTTETTAVATTTKNYIVLREDSVQLREALTENIGTGGIGEFDLDQVKVPAGGGRTWLIPGLEETEAKTIEGVILHKAEPRAYWKVTMEEGGGGTPPDCSSGDGMTGTGTPGGACYHCPLNEFGTAAKGGGKACKQTKRLFLLREGDRIPIVLTVPPGSLKNLGKYFLRLAGQAIPYFAVVTRFELASAKSADGITYSQIVPTMVSRLEPSEVDKVRAYKEAMSALIHKASVIDISDVRS